MELFGESLTLPDFPTGSDLIGIGMSDWDGYAIPLASKFNYRNTYYHQEPRLDITRLDPAVEGTIDFIIASDVFEHIPSPISIAFENVRKSLKSDGVLIFTAPYHKDGKTVEHFPDLFDYQIVETSGRYTLKNISREGVLQIYENLVFHGGDGSTLEMRIFSESSLIEEFRKAGFNNLKIYKAPAFNHGIYQSEDWSLPIAARIL
jgi:SAM-dependent methyltransferase